MERWKEVIQNERIIFNLVNYFAWRNNITLKELLDEIILIGSNKSDEEKEKETGWKIPFRSNSQVKNNYVKKNEFVINKEDVEKL
jgi:hypothetical protein